MIQDSLYDGTALEKFRQMITAQGGDSSIPRDRCIANERTRPS